jgi:hypothetical protein
MRGLFIKNTPIVNGKNITQINNKKKLSNHFMDIDNPQQILSSMQNTKMHSMKLKGVVEKRRYV